jgi:CheY-like chemotaxis protein
LDQVLTNLVTNAIKFTPEGGRIEVSAENKEKEIQVAVADNGVGISPDHQEAIFDRFTQIRSQDKGHSATQGIGLGLAICKEIISHHRGQIWVESELGKGSRFVFKIPIDPRSDRRIEKNILVVDDEESICEMLKMNLTQAGHRVSVAKNGRQAIQRLQEKENPLDLVFLDLMLPMVSGVEVFKVIRQMVIKPEVVVITAYPNSDLLFQAMEFGPLTVIIKPFKMENILELVSRNVSSSDGSSLSGKTT